jgi:branched-chain amino acid transport system permease protein
MAQAQATALVPERRVFPLTPAALGASIAALAVIALIPLVYQDQYDLSLIITTFILITLNSSWNFLLGIAGVWNFGQLAIYAAGGYGAGLLMIHTGVSPWLALLGGGLGAAALSTALAFPTLRLYGIYTALLTFSFAQVIQFVILNNPGEVTGGSFGLPLVDGLFPSLSALGSIQAYYWTSLVIAALTVLAVAWIIRTPLGLALRTVRDSLPYGAARGVGVLRYRVIAFAISGFMAGVAGGLYVSFNGTIQPSIMGLTPMAIYVTMLVIGGLGSVLGPVVGTVLLMIIQTSLAEHPAIQLGILGIALLLILLFIPRGLVGEATTLTRRFRAWLAEGSDESQVASDDDEPPGEGVAVRKREEVES